MIIFAGTGREAEVVARLTDLSLVEYLLDRIGRLGEWLIFVVEYLNTDR